MASNTQSFAIDKYSFCDVPMSQPDAKPVWNHHAARDHIYLVLQHEGPLEQPSDPNFPLMTKLMLKIIWRAETLESMNISDIVNQRTNYVDFANIICMIRSPSMALKYVNLRGHTLRRMQVRFCKQEDFQTVVAALERVGCPIQLHNAEAVQASQQRNLGQSSYQRNPGQQYERPDTASSLLSGGGGPDQMQYSRPDGQVSHLGNAAPIQDHTTMHPQGSGLAMMPTPQHQYLGAQIHTSEHRPYSLAAHHQPLIPRNQAPSRFAAPRPFNSSPPPRPLKQTSIQRHASFSLPGPFHHQRRPSFPSSGEPLSSPTHQYITHIPQQINPFESSYHSHLRRNSSTSSSLLSRIQTDTSLPVSRGTLTSAGTLFDTHSQVRDPQEVIFDSQNSPVLVTDSQPYHTHHYSDEESIPPPRQLPDFEKINKVAGDKPLPSSAKLTAVFKSSKSSGKSTPSLKRKQPPEDEEPTSTAVTTAEKSDNGKQTKATTGGKKKPAAPKPKAVPKPKVAPKPKAAPKSTPTPEPTPAPKPSQKAADTSSTPATKATTTAKPKKPKAPAKPKATTKSTSTQTKLSPKTSNPSPSKSASSSSPLKALQVTTPSRLNKTQPLRPSPLPIIASSPVDHQSKPSPPKRAKLTTTSDPKKSVVNGKAALLEELNGDDTVDETLLATLINSEPHLGMLKRLETVWVRAGFRSKLKAGILLGNDGIATPLRD